MNKKNYLSIIVITSVLLVSAGCEDKVQTVDWYKTHEKERKEMLEKCQNNPGEMAYKPNCVNAQRAASDITWGARGGIKIEPKVWGIEDGMAPQHKEKQK